jgi:hypothetical protein
MTVRRTSTADDDPMEVMLREFYERGSYTLVGDCRWGIELEFPPQKRRALWLQHRDELLAAWQASGRRGQPWAERTWGTRPVEPTSGHGESAAGGRNHPEGGDDE